MKLNIAHTNEQGVDFVVVSVKQNVLNDSQAQAGITAYLRPTFATQPIVFMAQDSSGRPTYVGRRDLVNFCASIAMKQLPWREWTSGEAA